MKGGYSLKGGLLAVMEAHDDYMVNARKKAWEFRSKTTPLAEKLPDWGFEHLPRPIQKKILEQIGLGQARFEEGDSMDRRVFIPGWQDSRGPLDSPVDSVPQLVGMPQCNCGWFQAWQLPCQHIWHHHFENLSLTPVHFHQLFHLWGENGFEIYEELRRPFADALDDIIDIPNKLRLNFKDRQDQLREIYYACQEDVEENGLDSQEAQAAIEELMSYVLQEKLGWLDGFDARAWLKEYRRRVAQ